MQQCYRQLTGALSLLKMKMSWSVDLVMMSNRPRRYSCRLQQIELITIIHMGLNHCATFKEVAWEDSHLSLMYMCTGRVILHAVAGY